MVEKKKVFIFLGVFLFLLVAIFLFFYFDIDKEPFFVNIVSTISILGKESFSVNTILLRSDLSFGEEVTNTIKIINNKKKVQNFEVSLKNPSDLILIEEGEFSINPKEEKKLSLLFDNKEYRSHVFPNFLIIETPLLKKEIPLVLVSEDPNNLFSIIHSRIPKYDNVYPGGKLGLNIKTVLLSGTSSSTVKAQHTLLNFNNEVIFSDETDLVVGEIQSKVIDLPRNLPLGDYIFVTSIEYGGIESIGAYLFSLTQNKTTISRNLKFFIGATLIFILILIILFFSFLKSRDKLLVRMKIQQSKELKKSLESIKKPKKRKTQLKKTSKRKKDKTTS